MVNLNNSELLLVGQTMVIQSSSLSPEKALALLRLEEGHFRDMKAREIAPSKLTKTLSAFANADGGEVYIGVAQNPDSTFRWEGFEKEEDSNSHIQIIEQYFPIGTASRCEFLRCTSQRGAILFVEIGKTPDVKYSTDKIAYLRRGAQNLPVDTPAKSERLRLDKGISTFEDQTVQLDTSELENSVSMIEFILDAIPSAEPDAWLRKQRLIVGGKPVVAGALLFASEPQIALPKASIKIYRYKTTASAGTRDTLAFDPITIDGNLYHQIYDAVSKTKEIAENAQVLGESGLEKITYPTEAVHEIITNAVIHRDYSLTDDVHIRIFDNRIEVQSPGKLPGHITPANILEERAARNPKIVRLLNKFRNPPNKDVGEGMNTAFEAMRKLKLRDPAIEQLDSGVLVSLKHERLGTPEELIVQYLKSNIEINNSIARQICFIGSENTVKRIFQKMIEAGLLQRIEGRSLNKTGYVRGPKYPQELEE